MDDLDKIDKYEWYGLGGGYWDAGELIDPDDDPNDYIDREHTKACEIDRVISHLMGR